MLRIQATIKAPQSEVAGLKAQLLGLGIQDMAERLVPYDRFVAESRMNYDCVFGAAWEEKADVVYLGFTFEDSQKGREAAYAVEYGLKQIPLNLRYEAI